MANGIPGRGGFSVARRTSPLQTWPCAPNLSKRGESVPCEFDEDVERMSIGRAEQTRLVWRVRAGQEVQPQEDVRARSQNQELPPPPMYQVVILNDDYTPMEFVVIVLESFFALDRQQATRVMLEIHTRGKAGVGRYTRDVAETKAMQVVDFSQRHEHPLMCRVELA